MNTNFYVRLSSTDNTRGYVWYSFYVNREKIHESTRIPVLAKDWDEKKSRVKKSDEGAADKNLIIDSIAARITEVDVRFRLRNRKPTKQSFLRAMRRPSDYDCFYDYVDAIRKKDVRLGESTRKTENTVFAKLRTFRPGLAVEEIDRQFLDEFLAWLLKDRKNNLNTAQKNVCVLKKYVLAAIRDGYIDENPFDGWRMPRRSPSVVFLTESELQRLTVLYKEGELDYIHYRSLEVFLFLCFSSLHIGDARCLKLEQFSDDRFTYFRKKLETRRIEPINVPVSDPLRSIMINMVGARKIGPVIVGAPADQAMNRALKEIAEQAQIHKKLSLKVGRHTFATIFLRRTHDLLSLKSIMGHADIKDTLVYAHVIDDDKQEGVRTAFESFTV